MDGYTLFHFKKGFERKPYKFSFINTLLIQKIPKGIRRKKGEFKRYQFNTN
jgi:hypothetical protein